MFHDYVSEIAVVTAPCYTKLLIIHKFRFEFMDLLSKLEYSADISRAYGATDQRQLASSKLPTGVYSKEDLDD